MSATTNGVGKSGEFGAAEVVGSDVEAASTLPTPFDASAGDDWGTVLALACLIVGLIFGVLLLGGG